MKYIIHLDLNRTVLMSDAAGGRTMENTVNYLLAEVSWGQVETVGERKQWVCVSSHPSVDPPAEGLVTYKAFVDDELPYLKTGVDVVPSGYADIKAYNKFAKNQRTVLQSAFTSADAPGATLAEDCRSVVRSLHFPTEEMQERARVISATLEDGSLKESWAEGKHFLLPSFHKLLRTVQERMASGGPEIAFVFRTFGVDILEVAKELDVLCAGNHPYCPGFVLDPRFRLSAPYNTFYRDGYGSDGLLLAENTTEKVPAEFAKQPGGGERFYVEQGITVHKGFAAAAALIRSQLATRSAIGCRDYWEWWSAHAEESDYGKILLVDEEDASVHQLFFDDHVESHHAHIVDTRNISTGEVVPFERAFGRYLFRAEPYAAITDEDYFVNALDVMIANNNTSAN